MKIVSVNLNGIRAASQKGFLEWVAREQPDIVCMQETKAQFEQLTPAMQQPEGYYAEFVSAEKKGYSGVAIYSKQKPNNIVTEFGWEIADNEGRFVQFDYDDFSVISLYLPSGSSGDARQAIKMEFLDVLLDRLKEMREHNRPYIICGDWNIAHTKKDIKNWRGNQKNSGFLPEERAWLDTVFDDVGFVDAFRVINQEEDQYTWWSYRGQAYAKNVGWRIDYHVISPELKAAVKTVDIYKEEKFSDHAPLIVEYAL